MENLRTKNKNRGFLNFYIFLLAIAPRDVFGQLKNSELLKYTQNKFSIELNVALLTKADIHTIEGNYELESRLQSAFSAGINYDFKINTLHGFQSGIHFTLTKRNFFLHVPDSDLEGFLSSGGAPQIEDKELALKLVIPFLFKRRFSYEKMSFWELVAGVNLNYSGFSNDEIITVSIADSNYQLTEIFYGEFSSNNAKKPWATCLLGTSKSFLLANHNILSIGFFVEISTADYIYGQYQITIPNKSITKGTYSVSGSGLSIALRYMFTSANKKLIKERQKRDIKY
jgi:hypothetical protein